jgi:hypothetical protein
MHGQTVINGKIYEKENQEPLKKEDSGETLLIMQLFLLAFSPCNKVIDVINVPELKKNDKTIKRYMDYISIHEN